MFIANFSIICGYFCIRFIDFMQKGRILLDYPNLSSPNKNEKNEQNNTQIFSVTQN